MVRGQRNFFTRSWQYERSIQDSYLRAIQEAERFIYIENQYFIGSGPRWDRDSVMNQIPEALVHRIIDKIYAAH